PGRAARRGQLELENGTAIKDQLAHRQRAGRGTGCQHTAILHRDRAGDEAVARQRAAVLHPHRARAGGTARGVRYHEYPRMHGRAAGIGVRTCEHRCTRPDMVHGDITHDEHRGAAGRAVVREEIAGLVVIEIQDGLIAEDSSHRGNIHGPRPGAIADVERAAAGTPAEDDVIPGYFAHATVPDRQYSRSLVADGNTITGPQARPVAIHDHGSGAARTQAQESGTAAVCIAAVPDVQRAVVARAVAHGY